MKSTFLSKKNFEDLDLHFIFERLQLVSPYGERVKRNLEPMCDADVLNESYRQLSAMCSLYERLRTEILELKALLKEIKSLDHTFDRIAEEEVLSVTELFEVKQMAMTMEKIFNMQQKLHFDKAVGAFLVRPMLQVIEKLDPEHSGVSTFYIYASYSERLTQLRSSLEQIDKHMKVKLHEQVEALNATGLPVSQNGELRVPVRNTELMEQAKSDSRLYYRSDVPMYSLFHVKGDEALKTQKEQLLLEEEEEEYNIRKTLSLSLKENLLTLIYNTEQIGQLDFLIAKTQFSLAFQLVRPELTTASVVEIIGGRHLKVAQSLERKGKSFTHIDVSLKKSVTLITGANMGGKTVSLKLIGQVVAMAHYGFFVPCTSAVIPIFDFIFVSVGDFQSIDMGLSTFGGEIVEIEQAIRRENEFGLILIDELARGTNPIEGYAISKALIEHLSEKQSKVVITTHFDGLTEVPETAHYQVNGLSGIDLDQIRDKIATEGATLLHEYMDYRLTEVSQLKEIPKEALRISELMGLDARIIKRAKEILGGSHGE